jgi:hypothetical protein
VQLKQEIRNPTVLTLLNLAEECAGEWVSYEEVCERAGRTTRQAMGDLAGFTQLIKRHFKQNVEGTWSVEVIFEKSVKYRMPPHITQFWKKAQSR